MNALHKTVPICKDYVWGGYQLACFKELPADYREDKRIAETWEISTHEQGESSVVVNANETVKLSQALAEWTEGRTSELPFMIKYLDCLGPISIQVHPTQQTAEFLSSDEARSIWRQGGAIQDALGKEESLFVISEAQGHNVVHVFLGFEERKIMPLADSIHRPLKELAHSIRGDVKDHLRSISKTLGERLEEQCSAILLKTLYGENIPTHGIESVFAPLKGSSNGKIPSDEIVSAFEFHLTRPGERAADPQWLANLFSGIAVISMICELAFFLRDMASHSPSDWESIKNNALKLFGQEFIARPPSVGDLSKADEQPLLSFFRGCTVQANDWVRVRPGTIHSWQGGGNQLIEVSHRSNNTFRILDFGRELSNDNREMHYLAAMYSLTTQSFMEHETKPDLITPAEACKQDSARPECHHLLDYEFHRNRTPFVLESPSALAFLINPDGELRVTNTRDSTYDVHMKACQTLIVNMKTSMSVQPKQIGDRVLVLVARNVECDR